MATSSYLAGQKSKYRITLELNVMEDFNPHQIDWNKVLDLQGNEQVNSYTEDLSKPDRW
jgi:predicted component of type VI protein secretion system